MNCVNEKRPIQEERHIGFGFIVLVLFILLAIILGAVYIY